MAATDAAACKPLHDAYNAPARKIVHFAAASGSATTLVALGGLRDRALELSRLTAVHAFPGAEQKAQLKNFQNKQCTEAVKAKDFAGFAKLILSHSQAVFDAGNDETTSGYFTLIFSFLRDIASPELHDTVVQDIIALLSGSGASAALRLNILADLYNTLAPGAVRFELFLSIIRYAVAHQLVELLQPFFAPAAAAGTKSLTKQQHRTLLQEISAALDAAGLTDEAQQYRIAFLESLQGADAAVLAAAESDAVKAATGYFKAPVVSQKSNLPVLDAVVALQKSPEYARVYQLLNIFAAGRVSDFTAFVGTGDNKAWMEALGVNVEGSERTVRLLTLASLASTSNHISYSTVAEALQVAESEAESWVVHAVGRGLLDAKCSQETKTVTVSRSIAREFEDAQWAALGGKLNAWRDNIDGVLTRMRSARMEASL